LDVALMNDTDSAEATNTFSKRQFHDPFDQRRFSSDRRFLGEHFTFAVENLVCALKGSFAFETVIPKSFG